MSDRDLRRRVWLPALVLAVALGAAYANSFRGVMLFDDYYIVQSEALHEPIDWKAVLGSPRPMVEISLAMNHSLGGLEPRGYHVVNLVVHVLATLILFGLVRRSLCVPGFLGRIAPGDAAWPAFATAMLWGLHPIQTQSVTYIIQRAESMMGMFYLAMLYCIARMNASEGSGSGDKVGRRGLWGGLAVASCALGMLSKQVMVTAPLAAILYERAVWSSSLVKGDAAGGRRGGAMRASIARLSWGVFLRRRWGLYVGLFATWGILFLTGVLQGVFEVSPTSESTVGFGLRTLRWQQYAMTQPGVLLHYLRLAILPYPLCLDHAWPVVSSWADAALPGVIVAALLASCVWGWRRRPALGFVGLFFFLVLAPTSSFIPIRDVMFEHRMYLPLASVLLLVVLGVWRLLCGADGESSQRPTRVGAIAGIGLFIFASAALGTGTHYRNRDYHSRVAMWSSVIEMYPDHARAHNNLAVALSEMGRYEESVRHFSRAIELEPSFVPAYTSIAQDLARLGRLTEAEPYYRRAAELAPNEWSAAFNLGNTLFDLRRYSESAEVMQAAKAIDPGEIQAYLVVGNILTQQARHAEAADELMTGMAAAKTETPDEVWAMAHFNLANSFARMRRYDEAVAAYHRAIERNPGHFEACYGLGFSLQQQGLIEAAMDAYGRALAIQPDYAPARSAMETLQRGRGTSGG